MNIDPRVMKQLISLQMLGQSPLLSASNETMRQTGTDFGSMLQLLISSDDSGGTDATAFSALSGQSPLSKLSAFYYPVHTSAASGETEYDSLIQNAAAKYGLDPSLIKAVIKQESDWDPNSVSRAGAKGLMQLMDDTGAGLGVTNPYDPHQNVEGGTKFLSGLVRKYNGSVATALAAYNAGPGRVDALGIKNDKDLQEKLAALPTETQQYVRLVLQFQRNYQS